MSEHKGQSARRTNVCAITAKICPLTAMPWFLQITTTARPPTRPLPGHVTESKLSEGIFLSGASLQERAFAHKVNFCQGC